MKKYLFNLRSSVLSILIALFYIQAYNAQVGIGTVLPEGALDLNTTTQGLVFPRVALTASNVELPITNPNGGTVEEGTTIYNTSTTTNGTNDVYPGIYSWDGLIWAPQFVMADYTKFEQSGGCYRTTIKESYSDPNPSDADNILGITNQIFVPKYTGTYKVEIKTNFGAGAINDFTADDKISLATSEGSFFFKLSGLGVDIDPIPPGALYDYTEGWIYTHSYSTHNSIETPSLEDNTIKHNTSSVFYVNLTASENYTLNLSICIITGDEYFINNGDSGSGQGHVGHDIPCTIEFTFLKE
ncbi:MAG: hypothetical protein QM499_09825 [Flavobacteriaceae bacterium]